MTWSPQTSVLETNTFMGHHFKNLERTSFSILALCSGEFPCLVSSTQNQQVLFDPWLMMIALWPNIRDTKLHKYCSYRFFSSQRSILFLQRCLLQAEHLLPSAFLTLKLNCMLIRQFQETVWNSSGCFGELLTWPTWFI